MRYAVDDSILIQRQLEKRDDPPAPPQPDVEVRRVPAGLRVALHRDGASSLWTFRRDLDADDELWVPDISSTPDIVVQAVELNGYRVGE